MSVFLLRMLIASCVFVVLGTMAADVRHVNEQFTQTLRLNDNSLGPVIQIVGCTFTDGAELTIDPRAVADGAQVIVADNTFTGGGKGITITLNPPADGFVRSLNVSGNHLRDGATIEVIGPGTLVFNGDKATTAAGVAIGTSVMNAEPTRDVPLGYRVAVPPALAQRPPAVAIIGNSVRGEIGPALSLRLDVMSTVVLVHGNTWDLDRTSSHATLLRAVVVTLGTASVPVPAGNENALVILDDTTTVRTIPKHDADRCNSNTGVNGYVLDTHLGSGAVTILRNVTVDAEVRAPSEQWECAPGEGFRAPAFAVGIDMMPKDGPQEHVELAQIAVRVNTSAFTRGHAHGVVFSARCPTPRQVVLRDSVISVAGNGRCNGVYFTQLCGSEFVSTDGSQLAFPSTTEERDARYGSALSALTYFGLQTSPAADTGNRTTAPFNGTWLIALRLDMSVTSTAYSETVGIGFGAGRQVSVLLRHVTVRGSLYHHCSGRVVLISLLDSKNSGVVVVDNATLSAVSSDPSPIAQLMCPSSNSASGIVGHVNGIRFGAHSARSGYYVTNTDIVLDIPKAREVGGIHTAVFVMQAFVMDSVTIRVNASLAQPAFGARHATEMGASDTRREIQLPAPCLLQARSTAFLVAGLTPLGWKASTNLINASVVIENVTVGIRAREVPPGGISGCGNDVDALSFPGVRGEASSVTMSDLRVHAHAMSLDGCNVRTGSREVHGVKLTVHSPTAGAIVLQRLRIHLEVFTSIARGMYLPTAPANVMIADVDVAVHNREGFANSILIDEVSETSAAPAFVREADASTGRVPGVILRDLNLAASSGENTTEFLRTRATVVTGLRFPGPYRGGEDRPVVIERVRSLVTLRPRACNEGAIGVYLGQMGTSTITAHTMSISAVVHDPHEGCTSFSSSCEAVGFTIVASANSLLMLSDASVLLHSAQSATGFDVGSASVSNVRGIIAGATRFCPAPVTFLAMTIKSSSDVFIDAAATSYPPYLAPHPLLSSLLRNRTDRTPITVLGGSSVAAFDIDKRNLGADPLIAVNLTIVDSRPFATDDEAEALSTIDVDGMYSRRGPTVCTVQASSSMRASVFTFDGIHELTLLYRTPHVTRLESAESATFLVRPSSAHQAHMVVECTTVDITAPADKTHVPFTMSQASSPQNALSSILSLLDVTLRVRAGLIPGASTGHAAIALVGVHTNFTLDLQRTNILFVTGTGGHVLRFGSPRWNVTISVVDSSLTFSMQPNTSSQCSSELRANAGVIGGSLSAASISISSTSLLLDARAVPPDCFAPTSTDHKVFEISTGFAGHRIPGDSWKRLMASEDVAAVMPGLASDMQAIVVVDVFNSTFELATAYNGAVTQMMDFAKGVIFFDNVTLRNTLHEPAGSGAREHAVIRQVRGLTAGKNSVVAFRHVVFDSSRHTSGSSASSGGSDGGVGAPPQSQSSGGALLCSSFADTLSGEARVYLLDVVVQGCTVSDAQPLLKAGGPVLTRCTRLASGELLPTSSIVLSSSGGVVQQRSCDSCVASVECRAPSSGPRGASAVSAEASGEALCQCSLAAGAQSTAVYLTGAYLERNSSCHMQRPEPGERTPTATLDHHSSRTGTLPAVLTMTGARTLTLTHKQPPPAVSPSASRTLAVPADDLAVSATKTVVAETPRPPETDTAAPAATKTVTQIPPVTNESTEEEPPSTPAPDATNATNATTTPPPPPVPEPPKSKNTTRSVAAVMETVMPEAAAEAVASSSTAAAIASSAASPSSASKAANLANIAGIADCSFSEEDVEPSAWQVIIPMSVGGGTLQHLVGAIVISLGLVGLFSLINVLLKVGGASRRVRRAFALLAGLLMSFLLPTASEFAVTLLLHGENSTDLGAGLAGAAGVIGFTVLPAALIQTRLSAAAEHHPSARAFKNSWAFAWMVLAEGCTDTTSAVRRHMFGEDTLVAVVIGAISGIRPPDDQCQNIGIALLVVTVLHLVYSIGIRPYASGLDQFFMIAIAFGQMVTCLVAMLAVSKPGLLTLVGFLILLQSALFVGQAVAMAAVGAYTLWRKKKKHELELQKRKDASIRAMDAEAGLLDGQRRRQDDFDGGGSRGNIPAHHPQLAQDARSAASGVSGSNDDGVPLGPADDEDVALLNSVRYGGPTGGGMSAAEASRILALVDRPATHAVHSSRQLALARERQLSEGRAALQAVGVAAQGGMATNRSLPLVPAAARSGLPLGPPAGGGGASPSSSSPPQRMLADPFDVDGKSRRRPPPRPDNPLYEYL